MELLEHNSNNIFFYTFYEIHYQKGNSCYIKAVLNFWYFIFKNEG